MATSRQKRTGKRKQPARPSAGRASTASNRDRNEARSTGAASARARSDKSTRRASRATGGGSSTIASAMAWARQPYSSSADGRPAGKRAFRRAERKKRQVILSGAPAVVRGGWPGFVILLVGDLVTLPIGRGSGLVLYWVALIAYAVAGNRAASASLRSTPRAARDGALAAAFAFMLTVPLRLQAHSGLTLLAFGVQVGVALVIGSLAATIAARARGRRLRAGGA